jgi:hypothetical protein
VHQTLPKAPAKTLLFTPCYLCFSAMTSNEDYALVKAKGDQLLKEAQDAYIQRLKDSE